jgi:hypothetical protein
VIERIEEFGIGFVIESWEHLGRIAADRVAMDAATERCLACRMEFTTERTAERIAHFVSPLLA